jgi:hypothetical protein
MRPEVRVTGETWVWVGLFVVVGVWTMSVVP